MGRLGHRASLGNNRKNKQSHVAVRMLSSSTSSGPSSSYSGSCSSSNCQDSESDEDTCEGREVVSLLDQLKSPTPADIARSRKVRTNNPPRGKRPCRGALGSDPKGVSPSQRVKEFTTEPFTISNGHLFCSACREQLSFKRSILKNHVCSMKHRNSKERLSRKEAREGDIASSLRKYNEQVHQHGETLPEQQQVYRVRVVSTFSRQVCHSIK